MSENDSGSDNRLKASKKDRKIEHAIHNLPMTHGGFIYFKSRTQHRKKPKSNKKKGK